MTRARSWVSANRSSLLFILWVFLLTRAIFYLAAYLAGWVFPEDPTEPARLEVNARQFIAIHWRWDAIHYYTISGDGYRDGGPLAFFPLVPLLIRLLAFPLNGFQFQAAAPIGEADSAPLVAGVLLAAAASLAAFWLLYRLARFENGDDGTARRAALYAAIFPLAFLYATPHTEALFLALSVGAFLAARQRYWIWAGVAAGLASATRPQGILLAPALAVEAAMAWRRGELRGNDRWRALAGLALTPLGLLLFMVYLWNRTGDPFAFADAQESEWGRQRQNPLRTLYDGLKFALDPALSPDREVWAIGALHWVIVVAFGLILLWSARRWPLSYTVYGVISFVFLLMSPWGGPWTMHGLGRYAMVFFPVYLTLARWGRRPYFDQSYLAVSAALFAILSGFFVLWYAF
jgi:hypothetical protein